ncbi:MAG: YiiD C-terminal domain-containing protein [Gammaproteobacteria bacterium]|nr:YiiD C-terminal domain-containing protein [Gammaproteobacteria bacterium]
MSGNEARDLQARINAGIPLSAAMGYRVAVLGDHDIRVEAPLAPNVNVHGTGFAGSLYALGILTAWGLCTHLLGRAGLDADLVVAKATIRYRAPVRGDIVCHAALDADAARDYLQRLEQNGRARILVTVAVGDGPEARIDAEMHARLS